MKLLFAVLMLSAASIFGQDDTLRYRHGFTLEFDKDFIKDAGYKYRFSTDWAASIKLFWEFDSYSSAYADEANQFFYTNTNNTIAPTLGVEYTFMRIQDISLIGCASLGYIRNWESIVDRVTPSGLTRNVYFADIGLTVEYWITKQFTVSGSQRVGFSYSDRRYAKPDISRIDRSFYLGSAVASLSFYF